MTIEDVLIAGLAPEVAGKSRMGDVRRSRAAGATAPRVLMTTECVGGIFSYATTLARELSSRGIAVHLATMGPPMRPDQHAVVRSIPNVQIHESTFALEWMDDPWDDIARAGEWLLALERELAPDIVHLNGYAHAACGFRAPVVVVAHSCMLSWWRAVHGAEAPERYATYRRAVARGLRAATSVIAVSHAFKAMLERHYGAIEHASVVHDGACDVVLGSLEKEPVVLSAGRVGDAAKNVGAVVRVAPRLPWPVRVAGSDCEATPNVTPLGLLSPSALEREMARAAVFALPAKYEPFGLCVLEAAQQACALVLGDIDTLREIWGAAALYVPPDDADALARAIDLLARDHALRTCLGVEARRRAERYTAAAMSDRIVEIYSRPKGDVRRCA